MILITGINGELGSALIKKLYNNNQNKIVGLDIKKPKEAIKPFLSKTYTGDIRDKKLIEKIFIENQITEIYHLAAVLSTKAESIPFLSNEINVDGFINLIEGIQKRNINTKFFFPSSIAVYLLNNKNDVSITEDQFCNPNNIYGCNKLYCEKLGTYFSHYSDLKNNIDLTSAPWFSQL